MKGTFRYCYGLNVLTPILVCSLFPRPQQQGLLGTTSAFHLSSSSSCRPSLFANARPDDDDEVVESSLNRRAFGSGLLLAVVPTVAATTSLLLLPPHAQANRGGGETATATPLLRVTITLKDANVDFNDDEASLLSAIYITARPSTADNVPRAILDGSRGKPPPVLIARIPGVVSFPFQVDLTSKDVTMEGYTAAKEDKEEGDSFWWRDSGLVVSARLDSDGVAATRDPNDLVGRSLVEPGKTMNVTIELQGRGAAGKFFTKQKGQKLTDRQ